MITKFNLGEPKDNQQKLIAELLVSLKEVTDIFMKQHIDSDMNSHSAVILSDAAVGYAGSMIGFLVDMISKEDQKNSFIERAKNVFNLYMESIKETKHDHH